MEMLIDVLQSVGMIAVAIACIKMCLIMGKVVKILKGDEINGSKNNEKGGKG